MATVSSTFDSYRVWYFSPAESGQYEAVIGCYSRGAYAGRIEFHKESSPDSVLRSLARQGVLTVRYRLSRFSDVLQILLHDKPLFLHVDDLSGVGALANYEVEPTGEDEP